MPQDRWNYGPRRKMKKRTLAQNLNEQGGLGTSYNSSSPETKQSRQRSTPVPISPNAMAGRSTRGTLGKRTARLAGSDRYVWRGAPEPMQRWIQAERDRLIGRKRGARRA